MEISGQRKNRKNNERDLESVYCICDWVNNEGSLEKTRTLGGKSRTVWWICQSPKSITNHLVRSLKQELKGKLKCKLYISNKHPWRRKLHWTAQEDRLQFRYNTACTAWMGMLGCSAIILYQSVLISLKGQAFPFPSCGLDLKCVIMDERQPQLVHSWRPMGPEAVKTEPSW